LDRAQNFGFILNNVSRLYVKRFETLANQLPLTLSQCKALNHLARNQGISQTRLADIADIEPMTLVRILDRMELDGWIERRTDPVDRRARALYLTSDATPILERVGRVTAQIRGEVLAGLSAGERDQLMSLLEQVHRNMLGSCSTTHPPSPSRRAVTRSAAD
jgi:DNA-binding MarR family transcriptional regulator